MTDDNKLIEARQEAVERLRSAFMRVQAAKRGKSTREGPMKLIWDVINAVPDALYHLSNMPEFEADLAAEQLADAEAKQADAVREAVEACLTVIRGYDRQPFPGFEAGVRLVKQDIAGRVEKHFRAQLKEPTHD